MKLPSVTTTLTVLAIIWCAAGVAAHGMTILAYPLAWSVLCIFFFALNKGFDLAYAAPARPAVEKRAKLAARSATGVRTEEQVSAA